MTIDIKRVYNMLKNYIVGPKALNSFVTYSGKRWIGEPTVSTDSIIELQTYRYLNAIVSSVWTTWMEHSCQLVFLTWFPVRGEIRERESLLKYVTRIELLRQILVFLIPNYYPSKDKAVTNYKRVTVGRCQFGRYFMKVACRL